MLRKTTTATLIGVDAKLITVEIDVQPGLPYVHLVGLAGTTIKESRERVRAAIMNSGYEFPKQRVAISLSPAGIPKEGSHFDLPIAVGVLAGPLLEKRIGQFGIIGELSLDGKVKGVRGALPLAMSMREAGIEKIIIPEENAEEAALLTDVFLYPVTSLKECMEFLLGNQEIPPYKSGRRQMGTAGYMLDFSDVKGQDTVKRGLVIAAAGNHGVLMMGNPGCGKTMMAKRIPTIMPDMTYEEMLEVVKVYSAAGSSELEKILAGSRPFRAPHYTITKAAMIGGGSVLRPGEISLAHNGVLFLDELGEYSHAVTELLRQPLEDGVINLHRANSEIEFPCRMMLIAAANPCKCGYRGDEKHRCKCTDREISNYYSKFSGPLMDRIDMHIMVKPVPEADLKADKVWMSSEEMKCRVMEAARRQKSRYKNEGIQFNSRMSERDISRYCVMDSAARETAEYAFNKYSMSMRSYHKLLKIARTIADIEDSEKIGEYHVAEACQYRIKEDFQGEE